METKAHIRKRILAARDGMTVPERMEKSRRIVWQLMKHSAYRNAEHLLCYVSFKSEVDTFVLMEQALKDGKKLYCPKVHRDRAGNKNGDEKEMDFYRIRSLDVLKKGYQGIMEPPACLDMMFTKDTALEGQCLMVMPGSAFDRERNRIGYGGGYYDRYLGKYAGIAVMAVCFDLQMVEKVPAEEYDRKADIIFTENHVYF